MRPNKQHKNKYRDILFVLISSFAVVVAWIGFNLYHIYVTTTISEDLQLKLSPIEGKFDMNTMNSLKSREKIVPAFEKQSITSSQSATASQSSSRNAEPLVEEQDTQPSSSRSASTNPQINILGQ